MAPAFPRTLALPPSAFPHVAVIATAYENVDLSVGFPETRMRTIARYVDLSLPSLVQVSFDPALRVAASDSASRHVHSYRD